MRAALPNSVKWLKRLYCAAVIVWGFIPPVIMLVLLFIPATFASGKWLWSTMAVLWSLASLVIFFVVLHGGFGGRRSARTLQGLIGLMCTFVVGLPAILVSSLPLIGSPVDFVESLNPRGNEVVLDEGVLDGNRKPVLYIVGIDLSTSFIADGRDDRLGDVYEALDGMFWSEGGRGFHDSLDSRDLFLYFGFADKSALLATNEEGRSGRETLRRRPSEALRSVTLEYLAGQGQRNNRINLNRDVTDIVDFLDGKVCAEIRDRSKDGYSLIRVLLFSDLIQSVPHGASGDNLEVMMRKRSDRLNKIESCLRPQDTSVTAFYLDPHKGSRETLAGEEMNVGGYFLSNLSGRWTEVMLDEYGEADFDKKMMMCEGLYSSVVHVASPLYLKYRPGPGWDPLYSRIRLPINEQADRVFLGLRSISDAQEPLKVRLGKERTDDFVLGTDKRDLSFKSLDRLASEQNPLHLAIEGYPDVVRDAHTQLLVAVPERSVLYKIPLVVLAVLPGESLNVIKLVLLVLHLFPAILAVMVVRDVYTAPARNRLGPRP